MRRRDFFTLLGSAAAWPFVARSQQAVKVQTIGFFGPNTLAAQSHLTAVFIQRLRDVGWTELLLTLPPQLLVLADEVIE